MSTTTSTTEKRTAVREPYIYLGEDAKGGTHVYRTLDETIFAFDAVGRIEYRFDIDDGSEVDHYVAHVQDARGWSDLEYGVEAFIAGFRRFA